MLNQDDLYTFLGPSGDTPSWTVDSPPDEAARFVHDDNYNPCHPLTTEELDAVVIQAGFRIVLNIDYYHSVGPPHHHPHVFDKALTLGEYIDFLYRFYNTPLLLMEYPWAKRFCRRAPPGTSSSVTLAEFMGDHRFYEGVCDGIILWGS